MVNVAHIAAGQDTFVEVPIASFTGDLGAILGNGAVL